MVEHIIFINWKDAATLPQPAISNLLKIRQFANYRPTAEFYAEQVGPIAKNLQKL